MTLEEWAYIGEIIASAAVIASLLYLGVQIRQSNVLSRSQTRHNMIELAEGEIYRLLEDPTIFTAWTAESISLEQKIKLNEWLTASMRHREFEWFARRDGVADPAMADAYMGVIPIVLGTQRSRAWWKLNGKHAFDPTFVTFVDEVLEQSPLTDFFDLDALDKWSSITA